MIFGFFSYCPNTIEGGVAPLLKNVHRSDSNDDVAAIGNLLNCEALNSLLASKELSHNLPFESMVIFTLPEILGFARTTANDAVLSSMSIESAILFIAGSSKDLTITSA